MKDEELDIKTRILRVSLNLFSTYGFRAVTMDDIASELGMSKKTVYEHVKDKKQLIREIIKMFVNEEIIQLTEEHKKSSQNALDTMIFFYKRIYHIIQKSKPIFFTDLKKYYPTCWRYVEEHYFSFIKKFVKENAKKGLEQDIYRHGLDPEFVSELFLNHIKINRERDFFSGERDALHDVNQWHLYHLYAIVNRKGHKILEKYTKENKLIA